MPGLGGATWRHLLATFGSPAQVFGAPRSQLLECLRGRARLVGAIQAAAQAAEPADLAWLKGAPDRHAVLLDQAGYPPLLAQIADPPVLLLMEGDARLLDAPQLAIVGSRNASFAGREVAFALAKALAGCGVAITSGLAEGIDGAAHRGALSGSGTTIAVLGTGPDRVYPRQHLGLADQIRQRGLLVSEQPVGAPPRSTNFPRRNRIISGLSLGVLVVEASTQSGSLITARLAAEQGREVFAVPGSINNPLARGCHSLLRDGAKLVETVTDILEELPALRTAIDVRPTAAADPPCAGGTTDTVLASLGDDPASLDLLVARTGLTVAEVSTMLLVLQLDGLVTALPGGLFARHGPQPAR